MPKMTYEEWSEKNPIDWDEIEKNDNPDMLITKTGVEMMHYQCYLWECKKEENIEALKWADKILDGVDLNEELPEEETT